MYLGCIISYENWIVSLIWWTISLDKQMSWFVELKLLIEIDPFKLSHVSESSQLKVNPSLNSRLMSWDLSSTKKYFYFELYLRWFKLEYLNWFKLSLFYKNELNPWPELDWLTWIQIWINQIESNLNLIKTSHEKVFKNNNNKHKCSNSNSLIKRSLIFGLNFVN